MPPLALCSYPSPFQCIKWKVTLSLLNKLHLYLMCYSLFSNHDYCQVNKYLNTFVLVGKWNELLNTFFAHAGVSGRGALITFDPCDPTNGKHQRHWWNLWYHPQFGLPPRTSTECTGVCTQVHFTSRCVHCRALMFATGQNLQCDPIKPHSHSWLGHRQCVKQACLTSDNICACSIEAG